MYVKVSKVNKIIRSKHLYDLFTFNKPIYKKIDLPQNNYILFYSTLTDMLLATEFDGEALVTPIEVELIQLEVTRQLIVPKLKKSICICFFGSNVELSEIEAIYNEKVIFYVKNEQNGIYIAEFINAVNVDTCKKYNTCGFVEYLDCIIGHKLYMNS